MKYPTQKQYKLTAVKITTTDQTLLVDHHPGITHNPVDKRIRWHNT